MKDDVRVIINPRGDSSTSIEYCGPIESGCTLKNGEDKYSWSRIREDLSSSHTKIDNREVCNWMKKQTNLEDTILPLISFQSAARVWKVRRGDFGTQLKKN